MDIINSSSFYKFVCTASLVACVYCASYDSLFLTPYNENKNENYLELAELHADFGYYHGMSNQQYDQIKDSLVRGQSLYPRINLTHDESPERVSYYYILPTIKDENTKTLVDSLNKISRLYAVAMVKSHVLRNQNIVLEKNIHIREWITLVFGILSFLVFVWSLRRWYKERGVIDK